MSAFNASEHADERLILLSKWVEEHTPHALTGMAPASEDASFRRYFRVSHEGGTLVAMDAPPAQEAIGPWLQVARRLRSIGIEAPAILAADETLGFALLGDLGGETYLQYLDAGGDPERPYADAIRVLVRMQSRLGHRGLPDYDEARLASEMQLFPDWLLSRHLGIELSGRDQAAWLATRDYLTRSALEQPTVFVHRDYHSRNLMLGRPGAPGVLDFQDAMAGPITYDLVSLLRDCYVSWSPARVSAWSEMYLDLLRQTRLAPLVRHLDDAAWNRAFDAMGVQRHLKASGIFARLWHRDGKAGYLGDVPRTLGHIMSVGDTDGRFDWLRSLIGKRVLPALAASDAPCAR